MDLSFDFEIFVSIVVLVLCPTCKILKEFHISAFIRVIYLKSKIYRTLKKYLSFKKNGPFLWNQNICINFCFWYCSLLFICVCACTRLWAQTNSANSFKKYVYVENVDNFTLVLIFIGKTVIQSSHGSTRVMSTNKRSEKLRKIFLC